MLRFVRIVGVLYQVGSGLYLYLSLSLSVGTMMLRLEYQMMRE